MEMQVTTVHADGSVTESTFEVPQDLAERLAKARAYWKKLKEAGTPYWCIHKDRGVDHPAAYWKNDTPNAEIHRKHGVMCADCGGYIQEG